MTHLITLADFAKHVLFRYSQIIKVERTCRRRPNAEFLLLFGDLDTHVFCGDEACYAPVPLAWVDIGKDQEKVGFIRVGDPHLGPVDHPVRTVFLGTCLKGECV